MRYLREDGCRAWLTAGRLTWHELDRVLSSSESCQQIYDDFKRTNGASLNELISEDSRTRLMKQSSTEAMHQRMVDMKRCDMGIMQLQDSIYPAQLRNISDPPLLLYYRGDPECTSGRCVTIIGSRKASPFATDQTTAIAKELAEHGVTTVSGLATGIDAAAHTGCIDGGSPTIAVMACGLDVNYPMANEKLRERILDTGGLLLSEYPPGTNAGKWVFPVRNRILSGLGRIVLMMECRLKSGCMSTVQHALDQGRDVYAYPGKTGTDWAEGAHQLLRQGGLYFTSAQDILQDMKWDDDFPQARKQAKEQLPPADDDQRRILGYLADGEERSFDEIAAMTGLDTAALSVALTMLQLSGRIDPRPGKCFAVK